MIKKFKFEDKILEINQEIIKRKNKWSLTSIAWMDFSDVSQILRIHIHKKWSHYDQSKPLAPWVNRIITNQIKNLIRNNYGNFSRPCLKCSAYEGENMCAIYGKISKRCALYAKWVKSKKSAYDTKLPVSIENHSQEVNNKPFEGLSLEKGISNVHKKMQSKLKPNEWIFYKTVYIENRSEQDAAKILGYKTSEKNRDIGYKQLKNLRKSIIEKVKKYLYNNEIDI